MQVNCPTCKCSVVWSSESEFRPFCSKQCQLIDLGDWATEAHSMPCDNSRSGGAEMFDEEAIAEQYERQSDEFFNPP